AATESERRPVFRGSTVPAADRATRPSRHIFTRRTAILRPDEDVRRRPGPTRSTVARRSSVFAGGTMRTVAVAALGTAVALDLVFEEFPRRIHPVVLFGRLVGQFDRPWSHPRAVGAVVALILPLGAAAVGGGFTMLAGSLHPLVGGLIAAL